MKKAFLRILAIVCLVAMLASVGGAAFADREMFDSTKDFLAFLDKKDIKYSYDGSDSKYDLVSVDFRLDNYPALTCEIYFKEDCEEASLRVWDIVKAKADKATVLDTLNTLNNQYKFAKFVFDESDSTVQAELDMYIDGDHCGRSVYDAMYALFNVTDDNDAAELLLALD